MEIYKVLSAIQQKLVVRKNRKNKFGNYNYRSCEDILQALKPFLAEYECAVILTDTVVMVDGEYTEFEKTKEGIIAHDTPIVVKGRIYVKATAKLLWRDEEVEAQGWAREESSKKGMDASQLTGATSSYARKYALAGLFGLDDNPDADALNNHGKDNPISTGSMTFESFLEQANKQTKKPIPQIRSMLKTRCGVNSVQDFDPNKVSKYMEELK